METTAAEMDAKLKSRQNYKFFFLFIAILGIFSLKVSRKEEMNSRNNTSSKYVTHTPHGTHGIFD
jgi:hypothetical protein